MTGIILTQELNIGLKYLRLENNMSIGVKTMANYRKSKKKKCANCAHLLYTGVNEIYHCENSDANIHPLYRTMNIGESFGRCCDNCWEYLEPSPERIRLYPRLKEFKRR